MIRVKATREGLIGDKTADSWRIDTTTPFVALPSVKALEKWVHIVNPANGKSCRAQVKDVGPWNEHDDAYVFGSARPLAEHGEHVVYVNGVAEQRIDPAHVNGAGIDLGECVWHVLGMTGNTDLEWEFLP